VVQSADETLMLQKSLQRSKKRRFFQILAWNRKNQFNHQQAYQKVRKGATLKVKVRFFTLWQEQLMKR